LTEPAEILKDDLKIIFIPKTLHEHFECVIGKHVFIDKPWTKISRKKIIDNLQSQNTDSCFSQFQKEIEVKKKYEFCMKQKYFVYISIIFFPGDYK